MPRAPKLALLFLTIPGLVVGTFSVDHRISTSTVSHQQFIDPPWSVHLTNFREPSPKVPPTTSAASSRQEHYTVVQGDSLTVVANRYRVNLDNLAIVNHMNLWDTLYVGRVLTVPSRSMAAPKTPLAWWPAGYRPSQPRPTGTRAANYSGNSSFEQCVIARESGGNPQIWGGGGGSYWGLYQFSYSTWVGNGGNPADFGHASAAEQHDVFIRSAPSNWTPWDGCGA